jgi:hypothetical protein
MTKFGKGEASLVDVSIIHECWDLDQSSLRLLIESTIIPIHPIDRTSTIP